MKSYSVTLPLTGILCIDVEADSEKDAIAKALDSELTIEMIDQWEVVEQIVQGNVFNGVQNEAEAECFDDDESN